MRYYKSPNAKEVVIHLVRSSALLPLICIFCFQYTHNIFLYFAHFQATLVKADNLTHPHLINLVKDGHFNVDEYKSRVDFHEAQWAVPGGAPKNLHDVPWWPSNCPWVPGVGVDVPDCKSKRYPNYRNKSPKRVFGVGLSNASETRRRQASAETSLPAQKQPGCVEVLKISEQRSNFSVEIL